MLVVLDLFLVFFCFGLKFPRLFFVKLFFGLLTTIFSIVYLGSLLTYNVSDPGFKTFSNAGQVLEISNYFGSFGSYLSSYSLVIIGEFSYLIGIFILVEGFKSSMGIKSPLLILRFVLNFFGIEKVEFIGADQMALDYEKSIKEAEEQINKIT